MPLQPDYSDAWAWLLAPEWWADANCRGEAYTFEAASRERARQRWREAAAGRGSLPDAETGARFRGFLDTEESYADHHADSPWFPGRGGGDRTQVALAACWGEKDWSTRGECSSRLECLKAGLDDPSPIDHGVWGGHTVRDRRRIRRLLIEGLTLEAASAKVRELKVRRRGAQSG